MRKLILLALIGLYSCSSTDVTVTAIAPAKVINGSSLKDIYVHKLIGDSIGLESTIKEALKQHVVLNNTPYFKVKTKKDAKCAIRGSVELARSFTNIENELRSRCATRDIKNRCTRYQQYFITCHKMTYMLNAKLDVTHTASKETIYSKRFEAEKTYVRCPDKESNVEREYVFKLLSSEISYQLLKDIAPTKYQFSVPLIDGVDGVSDKQEKLFNTAMKLARANYLEKAEARFRRLGIALKWSSYAVNYNYGVMLEANGKIHEAKRQYKSANRLSRSKVRAVSNALTRINSRIEKEKRIR